MSIVLLVKILDRLCDFDGQLYFIVVAFDVEHSCIEVGGQIFFDDENFFLFNQKFHLIQRLNVQFVDVFYFLDNLFTDIV